MGYRLENVIPRGSAESLFLVLSFSGGGIRAAAFAYGVLEELARTEIYHAGKMRRLVDEIDIISAVSGGSFTAAYFGLFGDRIFHDFEQRFLKRDIQSALIIRATLNPYNWFRLASPSFSRSDLAAEYYDEHIFDHRTFGDMQTAQTPFITINATDMILGGRVGFTQGYFDAICSDLSTFPVARAVAASSAVPVLLSAVTLDNFAGDCGYVIPDWAQQRLALGDRSDRLYSQAAYSRDLQDSDALRHLHLFDGGLSDNLGIRTALTQAERQGSPDMFAKLRTGRVKRVVFIVVNATTTFQRDVSQRKEPGMIATIEATTHVPLYRYSYETVSDLRRKMKAWNELYESWCDSQIVEGGENRPAEPCLGTSFHLINLNFSEHPDPEERHYLENVPTSFRLPAEAVNRLRSAGAFLLQQNPEYKHLLREVDRYRRNKLSY